MYFYIFTKNSVNTIAEKLKKSTEKKWKKSQEAARDAFNDGTDATAIENTKDDEKKCKLKRDRAAAAFVASETEEGSEIVITHLDRLDGTHVFDMMVPTDDRSNDTTGRYSKRRSEHREWSTVVKIFIPSPSFKPVSVSLSRFSQSKTPKQVFFNPIHILTLLPHFSLIIIINLLFSF